MKRKRKNAWVKTSDRYPTEEGRYLVFAKTEDEKIVFTQIAWFCPDAECKWELLPEVWAKAITHWMDISSPTDTDV